MRLRFLPALVLAGLALLPPARALAGAFVPGPSTTHTVGTGPRAIATGDFNEDGRPDMAVGNEGASGVSVLLGLAGGGFAPAVLYNTGPVPGEIAVADFDQDGHLDFAVGHYNTNTVVIMRGTGTGTFTTGITLTGPPHPEGMVAADFNFDGLPDLASCGYPSQSTGTASVWLNTGTPGGPLSFGARSDYAVGAWPNSIRSGRVSEFYTSLVTANYNGSSVTILANDGTGHFGNRLDLPVPPHAYMAAVGPVFPFLSREQIVTANADSNSVSLYYFSDNSHTWVRRDFPTSIRPNYVAIADADADGAADVVTSDYVSGQLSVLEPDFATGTLRPRVGVPTVTNPYAVAVADFDLDGKPDLAASNRSGNTVRVTRGLPHGGWGVGDTIPVFSAKNQYGNTTRIAPGSGKWQMLDLCSSWCGPCVQMGRRTQRVYETWRTHPTVRFDYVTMLDDGPVVNAPSTQVDAMNWARSSHLNRPVLHADGQALGGPRAVVAASNLWGTPTLRLVDPQGVVRWVNVGYAEDTSLVRILANLAGVAVPEMAQTFLVRDTLTAATSTLWYGNQSSTTGLQSLYFEQASYTWQFFYHPQPAGTVGQGVFVIPDVERSVAAGVESWQVSVGVSSDSLGNYSPLPNGQRWKVSLAGVTMEPQQRFLPPGTTATLSFLDGELVEHGSPSPVPVSWNGTTLEIGDITPAMLSSWNDIVTLTLRFGMLTAGTTAGVEPASSATFALHAPAPNPAAHEARLSWSQPRAGDARLDVFDLSGRLVRVVERGTHAAGAHTATWNLADESGAPVGTGLYFARVAVAGEGTRTVRVTVVR
jgi:hypothetical protein